MYKSYENKIKCLYFFYVIFISNMVNPIHALLNWLRFSKMKKQTNNQLKGPPKPSVHLPKSRNDRMGGKKR
jgi:hypothetical protein